MQTRHEWDEKDLRPGCVVETDSGLSMIGRAPGMLHLLPGDGWGEFALVSLAYGHADPFALSASEMAVHLTEKNAAVPEFSRAGYP